MLVLTKSEKLYFLGSGFAKVRVFNAVERKIEPFDANLEAKMRAKILMIVYLFSEPSTPDCPT